MYYEEIDQKGNKLILKPSKPNTKVLLQLKGNRPKLIAEYNFNGKYITFKKNSQKHYHYKMQGYGFNADVLESLEIEWVNIFIDKVQYTLPFPELKKLGQYRNFSKSGYELQLFVKSSDMSKYLVE